MSDRVASDLLLMAERAFTAESKMRAENERLRAAISFWKMARWPEIQPDPHDMEGRSQAQRALNLAENTLYQIACSVSPPERGEPHG